MADDGTHGPELWVSDGTTAGTHLVKDIHPGPRGSEGNPEVGDEEVQLKGRLLFVADDGTHGRELWSTDGSAKGTHLVRDIWPVPHGSLVHAFRSDGTLVCFHTSVPGQRDWITDGTTKGTQPGACPF